MATRFRVGTIFTATHRYASPDVWQDTAQADVETWRLLTTAAYTCVTVAESPMTFPRKYTPPQELATLTQYIEHTRPGKRVGTRFSPKKRDVRMAPLRQSHLSCTDDFHQASISQKKITCRFQ